MVLVGTGAIDHQELVSLVEKHFSLPVSPSPIPLGCLLHPKMESIGSEVCVWNDELSAACIAVDVEGVWVGAPQITPQCLSCSQYLEIGTAPWDLHRSSPPTCLTSFPPITS